jgi:hypothetical protein
LWRNANFKNPRRAVKRTRSYPQRHPVGFVGAARENLDSGCVEWIGSIDADGYGRVWVKGKRVGAHRRAWELTEGPIPDGLDVLHRCDNRRCVNGYHLFLGTNADNVQDMVAKGRSKLCNKPGEANSNARLTNEQVREIRKRWAAAERNWGLQSQMARDYGVSQATIGSIVHNRSWS